MNNEIELENGYIDDNFAINIQNKKIQNLELYKLVEELNKLLYDIEKNFIGKNSSERELYIFTSFSQIHISCQSFIILIERELYSDAQIILRAIYEKILNLKMVILEEDYIKRILKDSLIQGHSILKKIKENRLYELINEKIVDIRIEEYKNKIEEMANIKGTMNMSDIADKVGMKQKYVSYKLLSEYTHNDLTVMMQNLKFEKEGVIINGAQAYGEFSDEILKFVECVEYAIRAISEYFNNKEYIERLEKIQYKYEYLWKKYN